MDGDPIYNRKHLAGTTRLDRAPVFDVWADRKLNHSTLAIAAHSLRFFPGERGDYFQGFVLLREFPRPRVNMPMPRRN